MSTYFDEPTGISTVMQSAKHIKDNTITLAHLDYAQRHLSSFYLLDDLKKEIHVQTKNVQQVPSIVFTFFQIVK